MVDDNAVNRKLAIAMLRKRGWEVEEAEDGAAALARLSAGGFSDVLLDISMPGMDGEEVCRRIRAGETSRQLRVVAYTAHALESEIARIMSAGFDDCLIKPINFQALMDKFPD